MNGQEYSSESRACLECGRCTSSLESSFDRSECPASGGLALSARDGNTGQSWIDWLSFVLPASWYRALGEDVSGDAIVTALGLGGLPLVVEDRSRGWQGWLCSADICPGGMIAWMGQGDTVWVSLSSGALGYLGMLGLDILRWLNSMHGGGARCRRLDIAMDDREGLLTLDRVVSAVRDDLLVTHSRRVDLVRSLAGGEGWTVYVGQRASASFARIYDKAAQSGVKGIHWVRVEVELKGCRAEAAYRMLVESAFDASVAVGIVRSCVDFRHDDGSGDIRSRLPVAPWWDRLCRGAERLRVRVAPVVRTIYDTARWVRRSAASAIAACMTAFGTGWIDGIIERGTYRMSVHHRRLLALEAYHADVDGLCTQALG